MYMDRPRLYRGLRITASAVRLIMCGLLVVLWVRSRGIPIPLSSILSTSGQKDLQTATSTYRMVDGEKVYVVPTGAALEKLYEVTRGSGATSIFLVDAPNDVSAVALSGDVFAGYRSANVPVTLNKPNPPRGNHWLVVFLGIAGSGPTRWFVDSVTVDEGEIRFNYHRNPIGSSTADIHYYYYWVPLGKLDDGVYNLELYDSELRAVILMRRVEIQTPRHRPR